ncbi:MAG TPA: hypothetical protein PLM16_00385 [Candidatus Woesebacteria bacterium]|nr:hypothetical protein [Candidatus Woesebacteria bacterium]
MTEYFQSKQKRQKPNYKTLFWLFCGFVCFAIIVTVILNLNTPRNESTSAVPLSPDSFTNYDGSTTIYSGIEFLGINNFKELEGKQYEIYVVDQVDEEAQLNEVVQHIVNKLNLSLSETLLGVEYYRSPETELIVNYQTNKATLTFNRPFFDSQPDGEIPQDEASNSASATSTSPNRLSLASATIIAKNYLNEILPNSSFQPVPSSVTYYKGQLHLEVVKPELAEYIEVPFAQMINETPVLIGQNVYEPIRIMVAANGSVQKATIFPFSLSPRLISSSPLLSVEQVIEEINQNQFASIIYAQQQDIFPYSTSNVVSGRMNSVKLEYRLDQNSLMLLPYYRFSGSITNDSNETLEVEILAPAVRIQLIQPETNQ